MAGTQPHHRYPQPRMGHGGRRHVSQRGDAPRGTAGGWERGGADYAGVHRPPPLRLCHRPPTRPPRWLRQDVWLLFFNSAALAARVAVRCHGVRRVLLLDSDVHQGNGTQQIFENDPSVLYVSLHRLHRLGKNFFPGSGESTEVGRGAGEGYTVDVPWRHEGMGDAENLALFEEVRRNGHWEWAPCGEHSRPLHMKPIFPTRTPRPLPHPLLPYTPPTPFPPPPTPLHSPPNPPTPVPYPAPYPAPYSPSSRWWCRLHSASTPSSSLSPRASMRRRLATAWVR